MTRRRQITRILESALRDANRPFGNAEADADESLLHKALADVLLDEMVTSDAPALRAEVPTVIVSDMLLEWCVRLDVLKRRDDLH